LKTSPACVAVMQPPDLRISVSILVGSASTVLYDQGSNLFVAVGYSSVQTIVVSVYDPTLLKPLHRYRLPLEVAWLLRSPRVSDGFLLFVGAQEPFLGTVFTINLKEKQVYEQDPPTPGNHHQRPRRRRLPRSMVLENAPDSDSSSDTGLSRKCEAMSVLDRRERLVKDEQDDEVTFASGSPGQPENPRHAGEARRL
jgi:hypothetical protein